MPLTPQIAVAGNLMDLFGELANATLIVQLCGFGSQFPRVAGTALIAPTAPLPIAVTDGAYNFKLWGNDVITPTFYADDTIQTFYTVRVVDENGNTVQINAYQFTGTETVDLSTATPYTPPAYVVPTGVFGLQYLACLPPTPQAAETVYTAPAAVVVPYYNGAPLRAADYAMTAANKFRLNFATFAGDSIYALCNVADSPFGFGACTPAPPQASGVAYTAPVGAVDVVQVVYNGTALRPGVDYTALTATTFTLTFATNMGDTLDALCTL